MSLEYCEKCDRMIDLDYDEHWEHFKDKWDEIVAAICLKFKKLKGGKNGN